MVVVGGGGCAVFDCLQGNVSVEHAAVIEQLTALQEQHKELQDLDTATKVGPGACCKHTVCACCKASAVSLPERLAAGLPDC
jgi:hypothetical protein